MYRGWRHSLFSAVLFLPFLITTVADAIADPLPEKWQKRREEVNVLSNKACRGDKKAISEVWRLARDVGDPVAQNSLGFLSKVCRTFDLTDQEVAAWQLKSALGGYPIGIHNYGLMLANGEGVKKDARMAVTMLERAAEAGDGLAAYNLINLMTVSRVLPFDNDKIKWALNIMRREGVQPKYMKEAEKFAAEAQTKLATKSKQQAKPSSENVTKKELFAALAISKSDQAYGWAYDHETQKAAVERATKECRDIGGGKDCQVVMIGAGEGCMAYHQASPPSSTYGWGIARNRAPAEAKAAEECRIRNGNKTCEAQSWVCNTRTSAPHKVVYQAALPPVAAKSQGCAVYLLHFCKNFTGLKSDNGKPYHSFNMHTLAVGRLNLPGCGEQGYLQVELVNDEWTGSSNDDFKVPAAHRATLKRIILEYRKAVNSLYPKCNGSATRLRPVPTSDQEWNKAREVSRKTRPNSFYVDFTLQGN